MFADGDVFRLDVAAREAVSELSFWLDGVLEEKGRGCQHLFCLFVCFWCEDVHGKGDMYLVDFLDLVAVHDDHIAVSELQREHDGPVLLPLLRAGVEEVEQVGFGRFVFGHAARFVQVVCLGALLPGLRAGKDGQLRVVGFRRETLGQPVFGLHSELHRCGATEGEGGDVGSEVFFAVVVVLEMDFVSRRAEKFDGAGQMGEDSR